MAWNIQHHFNRGEISPRLHARSDVDHWKGSLAVCVNMIPMPQGGLMRRPPFLDLGAAMASDKTVLIPFDFDAEKQAFVLEMRHGQMRVWSPITGVQPTIYPTPWPTEELDTLNYHQVGDILFVATGKRPVYEIRRVSNTNWQIAEYKTKNGPYMPLGKGKTKLYLYDTGDLARQDGCLYSGTGYELNWESFRAFDDDKYTAWWSNGYFANAELTVQLPSAKVVNSYHIRSGPNEFIQTEAKYPFVGGSENKIGDGNRSLFGAPRNFLFQGYDVVSGLWVTLDSQYGVTGWSSSEMRSFSFKNEVAYQNYRLFVINTNDSPEQREACRISQFMLGGFETDALEVDAQLIGDLSDVNGGDGFYSTDVGRQISWLDDDGVFSWGTITQVVTDQFAKIRIEGKPLSSPQITGIFRLGAWSATTGWPRLVSYYLQRLVLASTPAQPTSIWASGTNQFDFHGVSTPLLDTDAVSLSLDTPGAIKLIVEMQELAFGTASTAQSLAGDRQTGTFAPAKFNRTKHDEIGFEPIRPVVVGNAAICVGRFGRSLREFKYSLGDGGFKAPDISILSEHFFRSGIKKLAHQKEPYAVIWALNGLDQLISMTYEPEQRFIALSQHVLGGGGVVKDITSIPGPFGDQLWAVVESNGQQRVQVLAQAYEEDLGDPAYYPYLDSLKLLEFDTPQQSVAGLLHLVGKDVQVYMDGATAFEFPDDWTIADAAKNPGNIPTGNAVRPDGTIQFGQDIAEASIVGVGLPYFSGFLTLRVTYSQAGDSGLGKKCKVTNMILDVLASGDAWVWSPTTEQPSEMILRSYEDQMDTAVPLFTGATKRGYMEGSWSDQGQIWVGTVSPSPLTVRAINAQVTPE